MPSSPFNKLRSFDGSLFVDSHLHTTVELVVCLDSIIAYSYQKEETTKLLHILFMLLLSPVASHFDCMHQPSDSLQVGHSQQLRRVVRKTEQTSELGVH